jgi:hypothetical protein
MAKRFSFDDGFLYVCDPSARIAVTKETNVKHAQLYCSKCSITVNITAANIISLPTDKRTDGQTETIDKITFKHSPIYGGLCLRPECEKTIKTPDKKL